jgi:hypothetical protein
MTVDLAVLAEQHIAGTGWLRGHTTPATDLSEAS